MLYRLPYVELTCSELKTVKSQAKIVVFLLRVSTPNAHVMPSNGSRITTAFIVALYQETIPHEFVICINVR